MTIIHTVLVVGATGSIGRLVTEEAVRRGYTTRALVRSASKGRDLVPGAEPVIADLTDANTLTDAVDGIDAVVFTQGTHGGAGAAEAVDYGGVRNVLTALHGRPVRIALMTAIGVTVRGEGHDWKRRGERVVRASGNPYTIVRPGWFDYNAPDQLAITMLQGDTRRAGDPSDGAISRRQLAKVLVDSLSSEPAENTTFELVAEQGPAPENLDPLFAALDRDAADSVDGVRDPANLPADSEPDRVRADLARLSDKN
jgi:uncharacterized protein YbjT (DUF2867 family)